MKAKTLDLSSIKPYSPPEGKPAIFLVDIDGTVALHGDERGHFEYQKVDGDQPNWPIIKLVHALANWMTPIFLSGREETCRELTVNWLSQYVFDDFANTSSALFMRPAGDYRPDYLIKSELFDAHVREHYDVRYVLDDRDQVVKMWRHMGLTCLQVADGDF